MSQQLVAVDLTEAPSTAQKFTPGRMYIDENGRFYQYVKGGGTIAQYEYVFLTKDAVYTATSLTTTNVAASKVQHIGCLQATGGLTSTKYGWVFRGFGSHTGLFAASCVQDVIVGPTAVAGVVDDAATTNIIGLSLVTTIVGAAASPAWAGGILMTAGFA